MAGCAFFILLSALATACLSGPKTTGHFGRKMEGENIGICGASRATGLSRIGCSFLSTLKVALDTVALTILIHPSPLDMHIFQELYPPLRFLSCARRLSPLGPADGILRGAAGSFYFIDQPVQLQMAAASIFLLWLFNVASARIDRWAAS